MRWSFIAEGRGAQRWYRAALMAEGLTRLGEEAHVWPASFEADDHTIRGWNPITGRWDDKPSEVVVCRLFTPPAAGELFIRARRAGQVVAFDIDDDIWAFPDWNPKAAGMRANPQQGMMNTAATQVNMVCADVVVAATPSLAEVCATVLDTLGEPDVPIAYVRSAVVPSRSAPLDGIPPRVGWMGTWNYRGADLMMIAATLNDQLAGRAGVLRHLGRDRSEPPLPVMLLADDAEPTYVIHEHDWVDIIELPPLLTDLDLAVIPAVPHRFNASRSATTGLAFAACGVPFIASPTPEYVELFEQGVGLVADDAEDWATLLKDLLSDRGLRIEMGRRAREIVADLYSPERSAMEWVRVVERL